jgi:hypothetical protein
LGTSTNRYRSFEEAREFVRGLKLKSVAEWKEWCNSGQRPADIPSNPNTIYKGQWRGMRDWLSTNRWRSFEEAWEFVRGLRLKGKKEWEEWCKSGQKPDDIPADPTRIYKDEWPGWIDWLGYDGRKDPWRSRRRSFEDAREFARALGLKNQREWRQYCRSGQRPSDIPAAPTEAYRDEWRDWGDWLGYEHRVRNGEWRPFEEAREYVRGLGLKNTSEWQEWSKSSHRPEDIPAGPWAIYKDEWRSMTDWLGYYPIDNRWRSFEEAREYVRGLRLNGQVEWKEWCKSGQKPEDIPTAPDRSYQKEWRGYPDWLGTSGKWYRNALLALLEDLRPRLRSVFVPCLGCRRVLPLLPFSESRFPAYQILGNSEGTKRDRAVVIRLQFNCYYLDYSQ